jgi:hypothetical protein
MSLWDDRLRGLAKFASDEAARIEAVQGELVASGHLAEPDVKQMTRAKDFTGIAMLIDAVRGDAQLSGRVLEVLNRARPRQTVEKTS